MTKTQYLIGFYAGLGAVAPDILLLYAKRFTMPSLTFSITQYVAASVLYVGLAVAVALVFPFGGRRSPYKAFALGVALPLIVAGFATLSRSPSVVSRGEPMPGRFVDLLAFW